MIPNAGTVDETQGRIEVFLDLLQADTAAESCAAGHLQAHTVSAVVTFETLGLGLLYPCVTQYAATAGQSRVQIAEVEPDDVVIEIRARVAARRDETEARLGEHIRHDAANECIGLGDGAETVLADC